MSTTDGVGAELVAARQHLDRAESRFANICDFIIDRNHERGALVRDHDAEEKSTFEGGATRSEKLERYDLIPPEAEECEARRFGVGAKFHGANNWKNGGAEFIAQCINHMRAHLNSLQRNGPLHSDDDIGAMRWGTAALAWFRVHKPQEFLKALGLQPVKTNPCSDEGDECPHAWHHGRPVEQINPRLTRHNLSTE